MAKKKKKRRKTYRNIKELYDNKTGGKIGLTGYSFQLIYSCYCVLSNLNDSSTKISLEGIEDIDKYKSKIDSDEIIHIQVKQSKNQQTDSYFNDILKNFLEVYLITSAEKGRKFKLVYDLKVKSGNLSKLINGETDNREYWQNIINRIKENNKNWNWYVFDFDDFFSRLLFEKTDESLLYKKTKELLIDKFELYSGNEALYVQGVFFNVFYSAKNRECINLKELNRWVRNISEEISKGEYNPAYSWIDKVNFDEVQEATEDFGYFEGKKPTFSLVKSGIPVIRKSLQNEVLNSIEKNTITVIKSSSGQGKTTLAYQVCFCLKDDYKIYLLNYCKDTSDIGNIAQFFKGKLQIGEKAIILIDNLDIDTSAWNKMTSTMRNELGMNYKILITTREDDWVAFAGNQSNLSNINIIDIKMTNGEAKSIFETFKLRGQTHTSITYWEAAWEQVKDRGLLIEYVYLITHGIMLKDKLKNQVENIAKTKHSIIKYKLLRMIALADVCGVKIRGGKLLSVVKQDEFDLNQVLGSLEKEYFITLPTDLKLITGLHPVRSSHLLNILNKFGNAQQDILNLVNVIDDEYISTLCRKISPYIETDKEEFYKEFSKLICNKSYNFLVDVIKGLFTATVQEYYLLNKEIFDDANNHGGLFIISGDCSPWNDKEKYGSEVKTLENLSSMKNKNIDYLLSLLNKLPKLEIEKSDIYIGVYYLFEKLKDNCIKREKTGFGELLYWLARIDNEFELYTSININDLWNKKTKYGLEDLSLIFYGLYMYSRSKYNSFIKKNLDELLEYIKVKTSSLSLKSKRKIIKIEYVSSWENIQTNNEDSVYRIELIGKFLPIFKEYHTQAIRPDVKIVKDMLLGMMNDPSYKAMPIDNVKLPFNSDLNGLWIKSIESNYEFSSIFEWQQYWYQMRKDIVSYCTKLILYLEAILGMKKFSQSKINEIVELSIMVNKNYIKSQFAPKTSRPFENDEQLKEIISKIKTYYFSSMQNFMKQASNIISRNTENNSCNLALSNLLKAKRELPEMQKIIRKVQEISDPYFKFAELEENESLILDRLYNTCKYYIEHKANQYFNRYLINSWVSENKTSEIKKINVLVNDINTKFEYEFITPTEIVEESQLRTLVLGIKNVNIQDVTEATEILLILTKYFTTMKYSFIKIISLDNLNNASSVGLRINNQTLEVIAKEMEGETSEAEPNPPLPFEVTEDELRVLENTHITKSINELQDNSLETILFLLWQLSIYRKEYDATISIENIFLHDLEKDTASQIEALLDTVKHFKEPLNEVVNNVLNNNESFKDNNINDWYDKIIDYSKDII